MKPSDGTPLEHHPAELPFAHTGVAAPAPVATVTWRGFAPVVAEVEIERLEPHSRDSVELPFAAVAGLEDVAGRLADRVPQRGSLRVIPRAFPDAIEARSRGSGYDLNRAYPRDSGPETELAQALWDAVRDCDVVLDLHSSQGIYGTDVASSGNVGQAVFSTAECSDEGAEAVEAFNARYISPHRYDGIYKFEPGNSQSDSDPEDIDSLIRFCGFEGVAGHLIETTTYQVGLEEGVAWMEGIVDEVLRQHGVHL